MNSKFFDVNKDKQDHIINASLRLFTEKGYKDASTDVIVKEAGISKGLLFHYFISKKGLYEFICDYSTKYMTLELTRAVKNNEKDFFEIMAMIESARMRVARNYPYMQQFLKSIKYERDPDAVSAMGNCVEDFEETYSNIMSQVNPDRFLSPGDYSKIVEIVSWINDGFMKEKLSTNDADPDKLGEEFAEYLNILKMHLYKSDINSKVSIARAELYDRDDTVMDEIKMEMTFEERLMNGKKPLVEKSEDDTEAETVEDTDKASDRLDESTEDNNADNAENDGKSAVESEESEASDEAAGTVDTGAAEEAGDDNSKSETLEIIDLDNDDEFFDSEDDESDSAPSENAAADSVPVASTGEILGSSINIPVMRPVSSFSSGNIDEIVREANKNLGV